MPLLLKANHELLDNKINVKSMCILLKQSADTVEQIHQFIRCGNLPVWEAIKDHIEKSPLYKCDLIVKDHDLGYSRGTGPFSITSIYAFPIGAYPKDKETFRISFKVLFAYGKDEYEGDEGDQFTSGHMLDIPLHLVTDFNAKVFKTWCKECRVFIDKQYKEKADDLFKKYTEAKSKITNRAK